MTLRSQIRNTLRALAEIPAVVEMAREDAERYRDNQDAASLRQRVERQVAHIKNLEGRARMNTADVATAIRERDDARGELGPAKALIEELKRQLDDARNNATKWRLRTQDLETELVNAQALIAEQKLHLESCSTRIRELETQAIYYREQLGKWFATLGNEPKKPTMADLWRPIEERDAKQAAFVCGGPCAPVYLQAGQKEAKDRTHYIPREPPR